MLNQLWVISSLQSCPVTIGGASLFSDSNLPTGSVWESFLDLNTSAFQYSHIGENKSRKLLVKYNPSSFPGAQLEISNTEYSMNKM